VGNTIAVKTGPSQWDANTGQVFLDFEVAEIKGDLVFLDTQRSDQRTLQFRLKYDVVLKLSQSSLECAECLLHRRSSSQKRATYAA
jgi:hypothetical protein